MSNQDAVQKDMLCRHFCAQGWYVQPEVLVFHRGGIYEQQKPVTDIDVLALRPTVNLRWDMIIGDCKTLRGQSPVNRAIWLRGVMEHFSASSGIVLLRRRQPIEVDHKLFAASLGVNLLEESEFRHYDQAIVYPDGSSNYPISLEKLLLLRSLPKRYVKLKDFCEYVYQLSWNEENRLDLLRKIIGEAQAISREIDPTQPQHLALILDAAGIFSLGLAECVGVIFNQYLKPGTLEQLDDALKMLIWGGKSQYHFIAKLRHDLLVARGKTIGTSGALALPEWERFLQLVRNMLEHPRLAFMVPSLLQRVAIDVYYEQTFAEYTTYDDLLLIKYAMLTAMYFCQAANFPAQTNAMIENLFVKRQSQLVHRNASKSNEYEILHKDNDSITTCQQLEMNASEEDFEDKADSQETDDKVA